MIPEIYFVVVSILCIVFRIGLRFDGLGSVTVGCILTRLVTAVVGIRVVTVILVASTMLVGVHVANCCAIFFEHSAAATAASSGAGS